MADGEHFAKNRHPKVWVCVILCTISWIIQIWCGSFLDTSDDLITFWEESMKNKMAILKK